MNFKNRFSPSEQCPSECGEGQAQQQFKDDCDINTIIGRFHKTGVIDHAAAHQAEYGVATPRDLHKAMNIIAKAESMFMDLPPEVRRKFNGSPSELLEFVQNPDNEVQAKELGLALSDKAQAVADSKRDSESENQPEVSPSPPSDIDPE